MKIFSPKGFDKIFNHVLEYGVPTNVGGVMTRELINESFVLKNARDRVVSHPARKMNFPFAVAEWISFMSGYSDVNLFTPYIADYAKFSTNGITIDGAYGMRNVVEDEEFTQVERVEKLLRNDPTSRRAVIQIYDEQDLLSDSKNTPCTLTLQYLVRDGKLVAITNMRSNDLVRGLTYDVFVFTMLQEFIATQLGIPMGQYFHNAGSFHLYESDIKGITKYPHDVRWTPLMAPMPKLDSWDSVLYELLNVYINPLNPKNMATARLTELYYADFMYAAIAFANRKVDIDASIAAYKQIHDLTIRRVMRYWVPVPIRKKKGSGERNDQ